MKYKVGDKVMVRKNLKVGNIYRNEDGEPNCTANSKMVNLAGKTVNITEIMPTGRYRVSGSPFYWVDEMFENFNDEYRVESEEYTGHPEVEDLVNYMLRLVPQQLIDHALDIKMHKTNPEAFMSLVNKCNK